MLPHGGTLLLCNNFQHRIASRLLLRPQDLIEMGHICDAVASEKVNYTEHHQAQMYNPRLIEAYANVLKTASESLKLSLNKLFQTSACSQVVTFKSNLCISHLS